MKVIHVDEIAFAVFSCISYLYKSQTAIFFPSKEGKFYIPASMCATLDSVLPVSRSKLHNQWNKQIP